jgi:hypothetical protein
VQLASGFWFPCKTCMFGGEVETWGPKLPFQATGGSADMFSFRFQEGHRGRLSGAWAPCRNVLFCGRLVDWAGSIGDDGSLGQGSLRQTCPSSARPLRIRVRSPAPRPPPPPPHRIGQSSPYLYPHTGIFTPRQIRRTRTGSSGATGSSNRTGVHPGKSHYSNGGHAAQKQHGEVKHLRWQADLQKEKTKVPIFKPSGGMLSLDPFPRHRLCVGCE